MATTTSFQRRMDAAMNPSLVGHMSCSCRFTCCHFWGVLMAASVAWHSRWPVPTCYATGASPGKIGTNYLFNKCRFVLFERLSLPLHTRSLGHIQASKEQKTYRRAQGSVGVPFWGPSCGYLKLQIWGTIEK